MWCFHWNRQSACWMFSIHHTLRWHIMRPHLQPLTWTPALWPLPVREVNQQTWWELINQFHDYKRLIVKPLFFPDKPTNSSTEILHRAALCGSLSNVSICTTVILWALGVTQYKGSAVAIWKLWILNAFEFLIIEPGMNWHRSWLYPPPSSLHALLVFFKLNWTWMNEWRNEWIWKWNCWMSVCEHLFEYTVHRYLIFESMKFNMRISEHWNKTTLNFN